MFLTELLKKRKGTCLINSTLQYNNRLVSTRYPHRVGCQYKLHLLLHQHKIEQVTAAGSTRTVQQSSCVLYRDRLGVHVRPRTVLQNLVLMFSETVHRHSAVPFTSSVGLPTLRLMHEKLTHLPRSIKEIKYQKDAVKSFFHWLTTDHYRATFLSSTVLKRLNALHYHIIDAS